MIRHRVMFALVMVAGLAASDLAPAGGFDFEWIGKIELDAEGLRSKDTQKRREAVTALSKYDITLTAPYLLDALDDDDWRVRSEAGHILGRNQIAAATPIIIEWLERPDPKVKSEAADILAELGTEEAVNALIRSLGDPEDRVRKHAATALGKIGTPRVVVPLIGRLEDDKSDVRAAAIVQLQKIGDRDAVIPLVRAFADPNLEVRKAAIVAVGHLGDPAPVPALLRLLGDPVEDIRTAAVTSLGNLRATTAADALIDRLGAGSETFRSQVAYALGQLAGEAGGQPEGIPERQIAERAIRALVEALADRQLRSAASEALLRAGSVAVPGLIAHLEGAIDGDATTVVTLLRDIGDPRASASLVAELDRGRIDRSLLLDALRKSGDEQALLPILGLLSDTDEDLRVKAMNALRPIIDDLRASEVVIDLLADKNLEIQVMAAEYLGLMRSRQAVPRLIRLTRSPAPARLRLAAVDALGQIADPRATTPLLSVLTAGPVTLHHAAASALVVIGDEQAVDRLLAIARDPDAAGRDHAARALGGILRDRGRDEVRDVLQTLAAEGGLTLSLAAIEALGAMGDAEASGTLIALLRADSHRRRAAATALGNLDDRAATRPLLSALEASDDRVAGDAAWALGKLADPDALIPLIRAASRRGFAVAINASAALARYAPAAHADALANLLHHKSRFVRSNAAIGLGRLRARDARRRLELVVRRDPSWVVRRSAARALGQLGGSAKILADVARRDRDENVREAAKAASKKPFQPVARDDWRHFYFVDPSRDDAPVSHEPYFLVAADGLTTALYTDARGIATEERFPRGETVLEPRAKASRY